MKGWKKEKDCKKEYAKPTLNVYDSVKNITKGFSVGSEDAPDGDGKP